MNFHPAETSAPPPLPPAGNLIARLRSFDGPPSLFWSTFLEETGRLTGSVAAFLLQATNAPATWERTAAWTATPDDGNAPPAILGRLASHALESRHDCTTGEIKNNGRTIPALALRLQVDRDSADQVLVLLFAEGQAPRVAEIAGWLPLLNDIPLAYQRWQRHQDGNHNVHGLADVVDIQLLLNDTTRFVPAATLLANEVARRWNCTRVSLGWIDGDYVRLQAISHLERFEKKMAAVQELEVVMEEAADQDEDILLPAVAGSTAIIRDHQAYSRRHGGSVLASLVLRLAGKPVAVLTAERPAAPFTGAEIHGLRLLGDLAVRRLADLKEKERWVGARLLAAVRAKGGRLLGVEHTGAKLAGILGCTLLFFLLFGTLPYRIEAPFLLKSDAVTYVPAPFDGYIDTVLVKMGDRVAEDQVLLTLDTAELRLEEADVDARRLRYRREAEKARAKNDLAAMKIALAQEAQAQAQLDKLRYRIARATLKSPYRGIVVEGDRTELLGAPVKQGDILFKIARVEDMYPECRVDERDIGAVYQDAAGQLAFVSRPEETFPFTVSQINPIAQTTEKGNVFLVHGTTPAADWWRPGMSGLAKIDAGRRNALWVLGHRTFDTLHLLLWY